VSLSLRYLYSIILYILLVFFLSITICWSKSYHHNHRRSKARYSFNIWHSINKKMQVFLYRNNLFILRADLNFRFNSIPTLLRKKQQQRSFQQTRERSGVGWGFDRGKNEERRSSWRVFVSRGRLASLIRREAIYFLFERCDFNWRIGNNDTRYINFNFNCVSPWILIWTVYITWYFNQRGYF
jgi:hypothetical protein